VTLEAAAVLLALARERGIRLACAESCTGGLLAAALTAVPGASAVFIGGIVAYANRIKERCLDVPAEILDTCGAVSRECVLAMAAGAARRLEADCALAVSGIAGPDGGTPEKPVGTVWFGMQCRGSLTSRLHLFAGDREAVRAQAVTMALQLLHEGIVGA
jgi:PncC family amidohydrolase